MGKRCLVCDSDLKTHFRRSGICQACAVWYRQNSNKPSTWYSCDKQGNCVITKGAELQTNQIEPIL